MEDAAETKQVMVKGPSLAVNQAIEEVPSTIMFVFEALSDVMTS